MKELRYVPIGVVAAAVVFATAALAQEETTPPTTPFGPGTYPGAPPGGPTSPGGPMIPTTIPTQTSPSTTTQRRGVPATGTREGAESRAKSRAERRAEAKARREATRRGREEAAAGSTAGGAGQGLTPFESGIEYRRPRGRFTFNLEDADLPDLVRLVSNITGRRFIYGGKVRSIKASIFAPTKVTANEAYRAFLSILELNGYTVVPSGRYLKIVETTGATQTPLPLYRPGEAAPTDDRVITRLHRLAFVSADNIAEVLGRFKSRDGDITAYAPTNTLIISDTAANIRRMLAIVNELDVQGTGEQIWIELIHYVPASELAEKLLEIFEASTGATAAKKSKATKRRGTTAAKRAKGRNIEPTTVGESTRTSRLSKIIPDDRTNSLIIVATQPAYLRVLELIRRLDIPESEVGGDIHVHMLQHADAEELAGVLQQLQSGRRTSTKRRSTKEGGTSGQATTEVFEGDVRISADKATNSLVIVSSLRDYASMRRVISALDVQRRQVFVEAVIMEISLSRMRLLGLALHGGTMLDTGGEESLLLGGTAYPQDGPIPFSSIMMDPTSLTGLALGLRGPDIEGSEDLLAPGISIPAFGVALQALQTDNDVNVLSTPNLLATDNTPAEISVGQNVPVQQGFLPGLGALAGAAGALRGAQGGLGGLLGAGGLGGIAGAMGRQNVGLTLKMTPHVNDSDEVRLELELEVSEVLDRGNVNPTISQRIAKTMLSVRDQQTVVLGGLIRDAETEHEEKVPILGDIPILGFFFRRTVSTNEKTNLLIILTPYIIRDASDFRRIFNRKMDERREFIERYTAFAAREYDPDIDYRRTNGALEEVNQALREAEAEAEIMRQLEEEPPPEHTPREPVSIADTGDGGGEEEDEGLVEPTGTDALTQPPTTIGPTPVPPTTQPPQRPDSEED